MTPKIAMIALCASSSVAIALTAIAATPCVGRRLTFRCETSTLAVMGLTISILMIGSLAATAVAASVGDRTTDEVGRIWIVANLAMALLATIAALLQRGSREKRAARAVNDVLKRSKTRDGATSPMEVFINYQGRLEQDFLGLTQADRSKIQDVLYEIVGRGTFAMTFEVTPLPASATLRAAMTAPGGNDPMDANLRRCRW